MQLSGRELQYLSSGCLEGFFFGLYSGIFFMYLQYHASKNETDDNKQNIVFHAIRILYLLSLAIIALNTAIVVDGILSHGDINIRYRLNMTATAAFACCALSPNLFLYTVAGSCGVAISVS